MFCLSTGNATNGVNVIAQQPQKTLGPPGRCLDPLRATKSVFRPVSKIARVLVRLDYAARFIVNANHGIV
jgi:hypothetical protein